MGTHHHKTVPGLPAVPWRRPATVVRARPSGLLIVVALACAGLLSLALAMLAVR